MQLYHLITKFSWLPSLSTLVWFLCSPFTTGTKQLKDFSLLDVAVSERENIGKSRKADKLWYVDMNRK